jgi:hypothetical protein
MTNFNDIVYKGNDVKWCSYGCTAKCENGTKLSVNVGAPGYETGGGQVCDGAKTATRASMSGQLYTYVKNYEFFTVDTNGIVSIYDRIYFPSELVSGLKKAEASGCCGTK